MIFVVAMVTALWATENREYLDTMNEQLQDGFSWSQIECRPPNKDVPYIAITTPIGNEYVCNKLKK